MKYAYGNIDKAIGGDRTRGQGAPHTVQTVRLNG
jgi:hypothetical protein